jgi:ABC-2 type transport system permease protein
MNNKLFILIKVLLKNGSNSPGKSKKKSRSPLLIIAILAVAFTPMVIQIVKFLADAYDSLLGIGQQGVMLSLGLTISAFVIFFFGIFYVLNTFYFSNDVESLLPLPLRPSDILGAKFIITAIFEYLTEFVFIVPILAVYGVKSNGNIIYWVYAALTFLILPIIPLVIASLIIMPIMRFTSFAKNKDRFRFVTSLLVIVLALGINFGIQKFAVQAVQPGQLQNLFIKGNNSLIGTVSKIFPSSKFATESLVNISNLTGLTNIFLFLILSIIAFIIFQYFGELLYFKGVMGVSESASRRRKLSKAELNRNTIKNSILKTYLLKELRLLFRTPSYFMNCVLMNFLYPLLLLFPFLAQSKGSSSLGQIGKLLLDKSIAGYVLVIAFGVIIFVSTSNGITSTSISREGQNLYINKYLPVSYMDQIIAKVLSGVSMGIAGMLALLIVAIILFKIQIFMIFGILLTGLVGILFTAFTGILIDLQNPKLNWDTEQKAVKQNMNMIFSMLICYAIAGLTIFGAIKFKLDFMQTLLGIIIIFGIFDIILYYLLSTMGVKRFSKIEA